METITCKSNQNKTVYTHLINGVEICNYKSKDKVYYGNLTGVDVLNGGEDFDVINLPKLIVSDPDPISGSATTALVQPVLSGNIKNIFVDPQDFEIERIKPELVSIQLKIVFTLIVSIGLIVVKV